MVEYLHFNRKTCIYGDVDECGYSLIISYFSGRNPKIVFASKKKEKKRRITIREIIQSELTKIAQIGTAGEKYLPIDQ